MLDRENTKEKKTQTTITKSACSCLKTSAFSSLFEDKRSKQKIAKVLHTSEKLKQLYVVLVIIIWAILHVFYTSSM